MISQNEGVKSVAITSDSKFIVSGNFDKTIRLWNLETGEEIKTLTDHSSFVNSVIIS